MPSHFALSPVPAEPVTGSTATRTAGPRSSVAALVGTALPAGLGTTIAMWILWWIGHLPTIAIDRTALMVLLATAMIASLIAWSAWAGRSAAIVTGLAGGLISAVLNLLLLGSKLVEQPTTTDQMATAANQFQPSAPLVVLTFFVASGVIGVISGLAGRAIAHHSRRPTAEATLGASAIVAAVCFAPLLIVGGVVTSTDSGMAVPDAVTSYGSVSFLFPISLMAGEWGNTRIFLEHTHRLFGTLVGLATILVAIYTFVAGARTLVKAGAVTVVVAVSVQGILGALRVGENNAFLAMVHGIFGQLVFAAAVLLAAMTSRIVRVGETALPEPTARAGRRARTVALITFVCVFVQLVFGAASRHFNAPHATWSHAAFAFIVAGAVGLTGMMLVSADRLSDWGRRLRITGTGLIALISVQFVLGFVVLWQVMQAPPREIPTADQLATAAPFDPFEAVVTTIHQTFGAAILATVVLAAYWTRRIARNRATDAPAGALA